jgi:hypothetical protein
MSNYTKEQTAVNIIKKLQTKYPDFKVKKVGQNGYQFVFKLDDETILNTSISALTKKSKPELEKYASDLGFKFDKTEFISNDLVKEFGKREYEKYYTKTKSDSAKTDQALNESFVEPVVSQVQIKGFTSTPQTTTSNVKQKGKAITIAKQPSKKSLKDIKPLEQINIQTPPETDTYQVLKAPPKEPVIQEVVEAPKRGKKTKPISARINPFPETSSLPSNNLTDVNPAQITETKTGSSNVAEPVGKITFKPKKIKPNKNDQVVVRGGISYDIENQITPAASSSSIVADSSSRAIEQSSKVDSLLPHDVSRQVQFTEATKDSKDVKHPNLTTEQIDQLEKTKQVLIEDINDNMENKKEAEQVSKVLADTLDNPELKPDDVEVITKLSGLMSKELQVGVEDSVEELDTKLREFLQTYDPNNIDYTSPDAMKQYALLTTYLLKQISNKIEFFPPVKKGVEQVEQIEAEINQSNNIVKEGKIEKPVNFDDGLDGIYEKYIDINIAGMKILPLDLFHPSLVIGARGY